MKVIRLLRFMKMIWCRLGGWEPMYLIEFPDFS